MRPFPIIAILAVLALPGATPADAAPDALIIDNASGQLFGGVAGGAWIGAEQAAQRPYDRAPFRLYDGSGRAAAAERPARVETPEICDTPRFATSGKPGLLVGAAWDAAPRTAQKLSTSSPVYTRLLAQWLSAHGAAADQPTLSDLWRIDLEGDGRDEVLLAATRHTGSATSTGAGDYSVLLLRKIVDGEVVTIPIVEEIYRQQCIAECALRVHRPLGALDLDGDGALELVVESTGYESVAQSIHTVDGDRAAKRLQWYCGA